MTRPDAPRWPERVVELSRIVRSGAGPGAERARGELWLLVGVVLRQRMRAASRGSLALDAPRLEDLASEKLLDLLARFDCGEWDPARAHPGEVVRYLVAVARNAVVDAQRLDGRRPTAPPEVLERERPAPGFEPARSVPSPEASLERERFVNALVQCVGRLSPRDRQVWMMRTLLELSSREIAARPGVGMRSAHVDVVLQRCRERLRRCMGHDAAPVGPLPPGTFAALWEAFRFRREGGLA